MFYYLILICKKLLGKFYSINFLILITGVLGVDNTADGLRAKLRGSVLSALLGTPRSHGTSGTMYTVSLSNSSSRMRVTSYASDPPTAFTALATGLAVRPTVVVGISSLVD